MKLTPEDVARVRDVLDHAIPVGMLDRAELLGLCDALTESWADNEKLLEALRLIACDAFRPLYHPRPCCIARAALNDRAMALFPSSKRKEGE